MIETTPTILENTPTILEQREFGDGEQGMIVVADHDEDDDATTTTMGFKEFLDKFSEDAEIIEGAKPIVTAWLLRVRSSPFAVQLASDMENWLLDLAIYTSLTIEEGEDPELTDYTGRYDDHVIKMHQLRQQFKEFKNAMCAMSS